MVDTALSFDNQIFTSGMLMPVRVGGFHSITRKSENPGPGRFGGRVQRVAEVSEVRTSAETIKAAAQRASQILP